MDRNDIFSENRYPIVRYASLICIITLIIIVVILYLLEIDGKSLIERIINYYL